MEFNPILLEVFKNRFSSIAEEMGMTLNRTAYSPNIKERRDYSCALFDKDGQMVAQAAHIPVHLGSMPMSLEAAITDTDFAEGDMVILNDPFKGGTHLPDISIVVPVFTKGNKKPVFYLANRAHHVDVGGITAGSMPLSTSLYQEGLVIPPMKIVENGRVDEKLMGLILNNVRTPQESEGDFAAQIMANMTGARRLKELIEKYGFETVDFYAHHLVDYGERMMRQTITRIPDGCYEFVDYLDDDGVGTKDIRIHLSLMIKGYQAILDFSQSDDQVKGSVNAVYAITLSAVLYVFRCLVEGDIPANTGCLRPIEVITRKGSIVDAVFPAAVAAGNVETSQRIVDVILGALAKALPEQIPAASQGTMNNVTIGGMDPRSERPFVYYETIGGGMGASHMTTGEHAVHSHMTNTLNTPIEALEYSYPFVVNEYAIRRHTGGEGKQRGGDGIVREMRMLTDAEVTVISERRVHLPYGLAGGESGESGKNIIIKNGQIQERPGKFSEIIESGGILRIETPGGGGVGSLDK